MKFKILVPVALVVLEAATGAIASALPLQTGLYRSGGSNYIQIAVQGERLCYHGMSSRGSTIASITADPQRPDFYQIEGLTEVVLHQPGVETLLYGSPHQLTQYSPDYEFPAEIGPLMQQCLDSKAAFFQQQGVRPR